MTIINCQIC